MSNDNLSAFDEREGKEDEQAIEDISQAAEDRADNEDVMIDAGKPDPIPRELHFELRFSGKEWNWVLWAPNHRAIATNPKPYKRRNDAERAIRRMRDEVGDAKILIARMK